MITVKSTREIWGEDFPIGGEWDAGITALLTPREKAGRWTLRREAEHFAVYFHTFLSGSETLLKKFPPTEQGEVDAKIYAIALHSNGLQKS